jgi:hypothetical protein
MDNLYSNPSRFSSVLLGPFNFSSFTLSSLEHQNIFFMAICSCDTTFLCILLLSLLIVCGIGERNWKN